MLRDWISGGGSAADAVETTNSKTPTNAKVDIADRHQQSSGEKEFKELEKTIFGNWRNEGAKVPVGRRWKHRGHGDDKTDFVEKMTKLTSLKGLFDASRESSNAAQEVAEQIRSIVQ